jgi:hypothetical protein
MPSRSSHKEWHAPFVCLAPSIRHSSAHCSAVSVSAYSFCPSSLCSSCSISSPSPSRHKDKVGVGSPVLFVRSSLRGSHLTSPCTYTLPHCTDHWVVSGMSAILTSIRFDPSSHRRRFNPPPLLIRVAYPICIFLLFAIAASNWDAKHKSHANPEKYTQQAGRGGCSRPGHLHLDPIRLGVNG